MTIAHVAGGQLGSDTTGNFSQSFAAGTCNGAVVFIVSNASNAAPVSGNVTYGGIAMRYLGRAVDTLTELGRVDAYFLGGANFPSGTQTIAFTQSGGANKRVYAASMSCAAGHVLDLYKNRLLDSTEIFDAGTPGVVSVETDAVFDKYNGSGFYSVETTLANLSKTLAVPSNRTVFGYGCLFSGIAAASLSVSTGTEIAEANFSGNSQAASFARNGPINNANLVIGWTMNADDAAAAFIYIEECFIINGVVDIDETPQSGAKIIVLAADDSDLTNVAGREVVTSDGSGEWASSIPVGQLGYAFSMYDNGGGGLYTGPGAPFLSP